MSRFSRQFVSRPVALLVASALFTLAACAGRGIANTKPVPIGNSHPDLDLSQLPHTSVTVMRYRLEVMVDSLGRPDMSTYRITGVGYERNSEAIRSWAAGLRFRPAVRDGHPVAALFTSDTKLESRVVRVGDVHPRR